MGLLSALEAAIVHTEKLTNASPKSNLNRPDFGMARLIMHTIHVFVGSPTMDEIPCETFLCQVGVKICPTWYDSYGVCRTLQRHTDSSA